MGSRGTSAERDSRFSGYGDRVGSGVELAPARWTGGEIISDPSYIQKFQSLKPRRMFYSPIGDGVVAADGIELKRGPVDLTPKVEIIQQRIVEKGAPGQAGRTVTERTWTSGGGGAESQQTNQSGFSTGIPLKDDSASKSVNSGPLTNAPAKTASAATPTPNNYASPFGGLSDPLGLGSTGTSAPTPTAPPASHNAYTKPAPNWETASAPAYDYNTLGSRPGTDPYGTLGSQRSGPGLYDSLPKSDLNGSHSGYGADYPPSGRTSTTSALFSEPGYRYEIKKDYMVTNPRELIHQYATTTPIQSIPGYESLPDGGTTTRMIKQSFSSTTEETFAPYPPYAAGPNSVNPNKFVRQLRDETMTVTQRQANQNVQPLNPKDSSYEQRIEQIRRQAGNTSSNSDVDVLTNRLVNSLHTHKY
ncbi:hypothetical protein M3Y98_00310200 [Aphelenchoides besseyi]|nr:hypothetical protein M3Y98_00310200 [Aphelenchoides besseyi]KAI6201312.1 hypothetical protein M3Y96_00828300 [Aphelenchoides besseyi]